MSDDNDIANGPAHQPTAGDSDASAVPPAEVIAASRNEDGDDDMDEITSMVEQPAKVMRIGTMIKQLLEEVRAAPLDEAGRHRLKEVHDAAVGELAEGLAPELRDELGRLTLPFDSDTPSEAELRIAQAQLVGWLEGLFHGIQTALVAQQMAARQQLEGMRRALPGAIAQGDGRQVVMGPGGPMIIQAADGTDPDSTGTGQYL